MMRALIMLRFSWLALSALTSLCALGCSSEDSDAGGGPYSPPGNGVPMSEAQACQTVQDAESDAWLAKSCGPKTNPSCPDYVRKGREPCLQYDQGTVQGCADYIAGLATCDDIKTYECIVKELPGTAPNGC